MLARISSTHFRNNKIKVCSLLSFLSPPLYCPKFTLFPFSFINSTSFATSSNEISNTHLKFPIVNHCNVGKLVFSKYSSLLNRKADDFCVTSASVNELILRIAYVCPENARKYLRICEWKPEDLCDLLRGFELGFRNFGFDVRNVECLWEIFRIVGDYDGGFKYLQKCIEVMASMLINVGMFREVESLLFTAERRGILLASDEVYRGLFEGYVNANDLEKALLMYGKIKGRNSVMSFSCYQLFIDRLINERKDECVINVYEDMVKAGFEFGDVETKNVETFIGLLCCDGKINNARSLLRNIVGNGWKPSRGVLSEISNVYCEKRDFDDLLNFFAEMKCAPDILVGNKVIHQLCSIFGIDRADSFLWELEKLGFRPNEITFGIFVCFCCRDGKLRDAFCYLSEIFTRGLKPDRHSYNAVISSVFKASMTEHARDILNDMTNNGIKPDMATFRALLSGYCKARQFDEVKLVINEMENHGLIVLSPLEDPTCKAFSVLGLDPMTVRVKRDNDLRNFRAEFIDELGNGLYLDGNLEEFEKAVTGILEDSMVPDFNLQVMKQCESKNVRDVVLKLDEMAPWGQELSVPALSALVRLLCDSNCDSKTILVILDGMPRFFNKLDHEILNMLIQALSKKGFLAKCNILLDEMHKSHLPITNETYNSVLINLCKLGRVTEILYFWDLSQKGNWVPELNDFVVVLDCLCRKRMLKELLGLFDVMLTSYPDSWIQICDAFLQKLCLVGFTSVGHILMNELRQNYELDHILYNHLINGYSKENQFSEALIIYDTFLGDNLALSSDTILTLIPQLCKANRFEHAIALKDLGHREFPSVTCSISGALVNGCCKTGRVSKASDLIREMLSKNVFPCAEIYNTLLQGHCKISDLKTANELLCSIIRRRIILPLSSYRALLSLLCGKELFHSALGLKSFMLLQHNFSSSVIFNITIFYLFQTGNHALVNAMLDELEATRLKLDVVGYNFLVHGFSVCKDMKRSHRYLNDMIMKGFRPSNRSIRAVLCYLCSKGQVLNALELSNQIELKGWKVCSTVRYTLVEGLLVDGRILDAERFVAQILEKGLLSDTISCNNLVRKFGQHEKLETAVHLLDQILKSRCIPDSSSYESIVEMLCHHDKLDRAMDFLTEMLHRNLKPSLNTWDLLIENFCRLGHTEEAERLLISMAKVDETPTKGMYSSVIDRYRLENNMSKASELLHRMQKHGYEPDFSTQWSVISSLSDSDERQGGNGSQGFLSRLLGGSGFFSGGRIKSKRE